METKTVQQLRTIARERGLKRYSRLKKADLIKFIEEAVESQKRNEGGSLLDEDFEFDAPVLVPEKRKFPKKEIPQVIEKNVETFSDWLNWLENVKDESVKKKINPKVERLRKQIDNLWKTFQLKETKSALKNFAKQYTIDGETFSGDPETFLSAVKPTLLQFLNEHRNIKLKLILKCVMSKTDRATGEVEYSNGHFVSKVEIILQGTNLDELYQKMTGKMLESLAAYQMQGSNWIFNSIIALEVHTVKYEPLRGSSYIKLPDVLAKKKAIINMKNKDDECFKWCVTRALNPVTRDGERITKILRKQSEKYDWSGIEFPLELEGIDCFEKQNETISVNVYGYERVVYPLLVSKYVYQRIHHVNLLLISDGEKKHYCLINSTSRLLSSQISKNKNKKFFCLRCLNPFGTQELVYKHEEYCRDNEAVRVKMPGKGTVLSFAHHSRKMRHPFVIYADFESIIKPIDITQPNDKESYTNKLQMHKPSSFCYYVKSAFDKSVYSTRCIEYIATSDEDDVAQIFMDYLEAEVEEIYHQFKFPKKMIFKDEDRQKFESLNRCWICEGEFTEDDEKVRDHCHYTGKFRGAAHNSCNLKFRKPKFIPIVFHNLSGYDAHLFIRNLGVEKGDIRCIPQNEEKYISFTKEITVDTFVDENGEKKEVKRELRFIDSFKFMATSLDKLVTNLASSSKEKFKNTRKFFIGEQFELMLRKGVYPYEYMDSLDRLNETELPPKDKFFSKLSGEGISNEDYEHAKRVWSTFKMKTLRDYHKLYNRLDVFLLCDVFENFRDLCITNYDLDPAWYYTAPGLSWDALLKITKVKLELLTDPDMLLMFERGIRGGISMISNRYGQANNIYMRELYDESKPDKYITYLDANNLYGWAMCKKLPIDGFKWMSDQELLNWRTGGCILEVDLEYPKELHDLHNDYPLAPESLKVDKVEKLIPNLNNKKKYVVHYENLKLYESLGLKITKIHRGINFRESDWMKEYIDLNTRLRAKAQSDFEKDFFKLMNNSVFGKTMENIRNRVDIQLVNTATKAKKLVVKPNFNHCTIFSRRLCAIDMKKKSLTFDKPVYIGMCILDISKTLMYDFHYNYIRSKYGEKAKLLFTDTDSLAYEVETKDFYKDIASDVTAKFDTSNFPVDHPSRIYTNANKKVVGMFKDEAGGKIIEEFVGLRSKLYSYKMYEGWEEKKCKGVKKSVIEKNIKFDDYKKCLFGGGKHYRKMYNIRSYKHEVFTEELNKIALSADDDKRIIQSDKIHTLAYGHYGHP